MATYEVQFYTVDPYWIIPTGTGRQFTWTTADYGGYAIITDNEINGGDLYLDDDSAGGESATATVVVGTNQVSTTVDAEMVWTVTDNVTGRTFQIVQFEVEGAGGGMYTLSEVPLVAGRSYTVNAYDSNPNAAAGDAAFTYADYVVGDDIVEGTSGNDYIDANYSDAENERIDEPESATGADSVVAGAGDDTVFAGIGDDTIHGDAGNDQLYGEAGNDQIFAGTGNDTVSGGDGNDSLYGATGSDSLSGDAGDDVIYGDSSVETLNWVFEGDHGTDLTAGFTQNTGDIDVSVSFSTTDPANSDFEVDTRNDQYSAAGEPFVENSSLFIFGQGAAYTSTTTIDFAAAAGSTVSGEVENVTFRINDIDWGNANHTDIVTVRAYDALGNEIVVTLTPSGGDTVSGNTITANTVANATYDADGSVLVEIAGPVSSIEIDYSNGQSGTQGIWLTNIQYETVPTAGGNDTLLGGDGNDTLYGEYGDDFLDGGLGSDTLYGESGADSIIGGTGADLLGGGDGNDTIVGSENDTILGGTGDDYIQLEDLGEAGSGTITIDGGTSNQTTGDTLDLNGLADRSTLIRNVDEVTGETSGSVTLLDGTIVTFSNIDQVICFTPGTQILTETGFRSIEDLKVGDGLVTMDNGIQTLAWIGSRSVPAVANFAPIRITKSALPGLENDLVVSPQHKMLLSGGDVDLHFGTDEVFAPAAHLVNGDTIRREEGGMVTYIHLMLPQHEVIYAEGAPTESFHVGKMGLKSLSSEAKEDLFDAFPHLRFNPDAYGPTARRCLRSYETAALTGSIHATDENQTVAA
ncbi:Ca2+-binding protein, RTX toxin-related [Thalassococcus halodurans]|uniref:Ca2+-binding protein, RTX toxin-related n=1 Tax=Thalassococcus halodurans TaxID=373675 RepID=A0A1H5VN69_9RHOB|nr:Hint domain-containing protein [Thalassococcus halodurans]SEF88684.1 Ca2+-binding protein, RTX toxin-related [Thalassococcus halodurans]